MRDYYSILNVARSSSWDEIVKSYRLNVMKYHPDRNPCDVDCEKKFKDIQDAYDYLKINHKSHISDYTNNEWDKFVDATIKDIYESSNDEKSLNEEVVKSFTEYNDSDSEQYQSKNLHNQNKTQKQSIFSLVHYVLSNILVWIVILFFGSFGALISLISLIWSNIKIWMILLFFYPFVAMYCTKGNVVAYESFMVIFLSIYFVFWLCKCVKKQCKTEKIEEQNYEFWYGKMICHKCDYLWQSRRGTPPARCASCRSKEISCVMEKEKNIFGW